MERRWYQGPEENNCAGEIRRYKSTFEKPLYGDNEPQMWVRFETPSGHHPSMLESSWKEWLATATPVNLTDRWTSVDDYLPDYEVRVLFTVVGYPYPDGGYVAIGKVVRARIDWGEGDLHPSGPVGDVWLNDDGIRVGREVIAWRPLFAPAERD